MLYIKEPNEVQVFKIQNRVYPDSKIVYVSAEQMYKDFGQNFAFIIIVIRAPVESHQ